MPPRIGSYAYGIPQEGGAGQDHQQKWHRLVLSKIQLVSDHFGTEQHNLDLLTAKIAHSRYLLFGAAIRNEDLAP
ncbi:hypothetical protein D3C78_931330 [compost metagenome]